MLNSFRQNFGSRFGRIKYFSMLTLGKNDTEYRNNPRFQLDAHLLSIGPYIDYNQPFD